MNFGLFATQDVGLEVARFLSDRGERIACLVLDANDPGGCNQQILEAVETDVVAYSNALGDVETLGRLRRLDLDLLILAWWPYIVGPPVIQLARIGCLNFHNSLLPHNRGKHPNFWAIVEGSPYGVTLHFVDAGVDTGDIIFQKEVDSTWEDTGETLHRKGKHAVVELFKEKFDDIKALRFSRKPQDPKTGSFHRARELDPASRIDLDALYPARDLLNLLRARTYPPFPAAWFIEGSQKYEVRVEIRRVPGGDRSTPPRPADPGAR